MLEWHVYAAERRLALEEFRHAQAQSQFEPHAT